MHTFEELRAASQYPLRPLAGRQAQRALQLAGGDEGDVVGANDTVCVVACFNAAGEITYVGLETL